MGLPLSHAPMRDGAQGKCVEAQLVAEEEQEQGEGCVAYRLAHLRALGSVGLAAVLAMTV